MTLYAIVKSGRRGRLGGPRMVRPSAPLAVRTERLSGSHRNRTGELLRAQQKQPEVMLRTFRCLSIYRHLASLLRHAVCPSPPATLLRQQRGAMTLSVRRHGKPPCLAPVEPLSPASSSRTGESILWA